MNCQEFENGLAALARRSLADARTRAEALAHEESCTDCAARLADERALSAGLRALATGMNGAEAPPRVEANLLAAFRARAAATAPVAPAAPVSTDVAAVGHDEAVSAGNVVPLAGRVRANEWSWAKTLAVATLAAAASLALFVLVRPDVGVRAPAVAGKVAGHSDQSKMTEPSPGLSQRQAASVVAQVASDGMDETPTTPSAPTVAGDRVQRASFAPRARAVNASYSASGGGRSTPSQTGSAASARPQEVATDFIPLMQGSQYTQPDGGHLVRVELPRSALASFGLPVNAEVAGGRVKADVIVGEDGIARAIRFVR